MLLGHMHDSQQTASIGLTPIECFGTTSFPYAAVAASNHQAFTMRGGQSLTLFQALPWRVAKFPMNIIQVSIPTFPADPGLEARFAPINALEGAGVTYCVKHNLQKEWIFEPLPLQAMRSIMTPGTKQNHQS